jgi:phosphotransferase family enzyme
MCAPLQFEEFHLLLFREKGAELLLLRSPRGARLPLLTIPAHTRPAEALTRSVWDLWGLRTYCLFTLPIENSTRRAAILEVTSPSHQLPDELRCHSVTSLRRVDFEDATSFMAMEQCLALLDRYRHGELPGNFAKPGCFDAITEWVGEKTRGIGCRPNGKFRQLNAGPSFSLIRFETDGPAVWFKAVGEPNLREFSIAVELASSFPLFVPRMIAARKDWNAWLSIEAEGAHPGEKSDLDTWKQVAMALGELQIASFGQTLHLLSAGCRDVRTGALLELVAPFLEVMADLMGRQTKHSPPPLSRSELTSLRAQLEDALSAASNCEIPNTIGHLDFNPGNLLLSGGSCVFFDWAEACAGTPFLTFQYLREYLRRHGRHSWESAIIPAYLQIWRPYLSPRKIAAALRVAPLLAVFAYAVRGDVWRDPEARSCPEIARHFRSLTRRMKLEAYLLTDCATARGALCPS